LGVHLSDTRPATTVDDARHVFRLYETLAKGRKKTWRDDIAMARRHLLPVWGPMPLRAIMRAHVHELLDTLVAKGLTTGVNRVQAVISRLFTDTLDRSLVDAHPAARMIKRFKEQPSERVLTDDELRALWTTLDAHLGARRRGQAPAPARPAGRGSHGHALG
jgi:integrase